MNMSWQIPRNCLVWLLLAQFVLILPHIERLPWWVLLVYFFCAAWRFMIFKGRWSYPAKWLKVLMALLCCLGIYQSYMTWLGLEPMVALLISGFCLKLVESTARKDIYLNLCAAYFVAMTSFLFNQDFFTMIYVLLTVLVILTAKVALHKSGMIRFEWKSLKKAVIIISQAIPLMLVLFIVMPRFSPLWQVPIPDANATIGMTNTLSPGDISNLAANDGLAFRVEFKGKTPRKNQMYWRGLVLSDFDGRTWQQSDRFAREDSSVAIKINAGPQDSRFQYTIIQEPTYQRWLFSLPVAYSKEATITSISDYRLARNSKVINRIKYDVTSNLDVTKGLWLSSFERNQTTRLPQTGNQRSRFFAKKLYQQSGSDEAYINSVLRRFHQQPYIYTLKPPKLGRDTVDEFLFDSLRGFCAHYASSFVYLMRAVDIPARVVVGYLGGETNPLTGVTLIHQFDAHAWAEVWLQGRGWVRVDPTAAVAPERIEFGLEQALAEEGSFLQDSIFSALRYRHVEWINRLRLQMDAFNYYWASGVLNYRDQQQLDVLKALLGEVTVYRVGLFVFVISFLLLSVVAFGLLKQRGRSTLAEEVKIYQRLCLQLEKSGYQRFASEGAMDFSRRICQECQHVSSGEKNWLPHMMVATQLFVALMYEPHSVGQRDQMLKRFKREVRKIHYQLRFSN